MPEVTLFHVEVASERIDDEQPHSWRYRTKLHADGDLQFERCFYSIDELNIYLDCLGGMFHILEYNAFLLGWGSPEGHNPVRRRWTIPKLPQSGLAQDLDPVTGKVIEI